MEVKAKDVQEYVDESGVSPFSTWLNGLRDANGRAVIRKRINRIRLGNLGDYKPVGEGVLELRIHEGPGYRVYFGLDGEILVILLIGGDKGSQNSDIEKAKSFWKEYWR